MPTMEAGHDAALPVASAAAHNGVVPLYVNDQESQHDFEESHSEESQVEDSQLVSLEIDTQATDGHDESQHLDELMHMPAASASVYVNSNVEPRRFQMPQSPEHEASFKFEKAAAKAPVISRPSLLKAQRAVDAPSDVMNDGHTADAVAAREGNSNGMHQISTSRCEDVPRHESDAGNDVPLPDEAGNDINERLVLGEKDPNLRQAVTNMAMGPPKHNAPGCATPPANTGWRPTQAPKKTKSVQMLSPSCPPFQDIESPSIRRHGPALPSKNPQVLATTPSVRSYLPSPFSGPKTRQNTEHQSFAIDEDIKEINDTPIPVTKRKHCEPQGSDAEDKLTGNKIPDVISSKSAASTEDASSHLARVDDIVPVIPSLGPEFNGRVGPQSLNIHKHQGQQQLHTQSNISANQGSKVSPDLNQPTSKRRRNSPPASANDPFPDVVNDAKPSSTYCRTTGLVNRPISNNEIIIQRHSTPNGIQDSPLVRVRKTKKSVSNVQAIQSLSAGLWQGQGSETHAPGGQDSNENIQKRDLSIDNDSNQIVTSGIYAAKISQGEKVLQGTGTVRESNRMLLSSSKHSGPTGDPQETAEQMKRLADNVVMTSDSAMEQAKQLVLLEKRELERKLQEQSSRNIDLSRQNSAHEAKINELNGLNDSLRQRFAKLIAKAQEFKIRMKRFNDDNEAAANFIKQNKIDTAECKTAVQGIRKLCEEAGERLVKVDSFQKKSKIAVSNAIRELQDQKEKIELNRQLIGKTVHDLQDERSKTAKLKKDVDEAFSAGFKSALDEHRADIYAKLTAHERELKKAIKNAEGETEQTLLGYLEELGPVKNTMKDVMKNMTKEALDESEPKVPKEVKDILDLVRPLSTSIEKRLQAADDRTESLKKTGVEVLGTLKTQIESMLAVQDAQEELNDRISSLQVANVCLEEAARKHDGSVDELQGQLNVRQQELENCQEQLKLKTDELQQVQAKIDNDTGLQDEVKRLRAANVKANRDRSDAFKKLDNVRTTLQKETEKTRSLQIQKAALEEHLQSAEAKVLHGEKQFEQHKANIVEELEKQRIRMEGDKRMSLKQEQESQVQKIMGQKKILEKLQSDFKKMKEVAEGRSNLISELHAQIATLKNTNAEQAAELAHFEGQSSSNLVEYDTLLEAMRSRNLEILQIKIRLDDHRERFLSNSKRVDDIEKCASEVALATQNLQARLVQYERIEGSIRDYSQRHDISIDDTTVEGFIEKLASLKAPVAVKYQSRSTSVDGDLGQQLGNIGLVNSSLNKGGDVARRTQSSTSDHLKQSLEVSGSNEAQSQQEKRVQVPRSPEVLDSQASYVPSPSPIPTMRQTRRVAQGRNSMQPPAKEFQKSTTEVTEITTKVTTVRESRTVHGSQNARRHLPEQTCRTPLRGSVVKDSQDGIRFESDINDSPMTDVSPVIDFISDNPKEDHSQVLTRQRSNKWSNTDKLGQSSQKTLIPPNDRNKSQGGKPLKSILKRPAPTKDDAVLKGVHASQDRALASPTSQKAKSTYPRRGLVPVSSGPSFSKCLPSHKSLAHDKSNEIPKSENSHQSSQGDGLDHISRDSPVNLPRQNRRKRTTSSISNGTSAEPPLKRPRLSMPYFSTGVRK